MLEVKKGQRIYGSDSSVCMRIKNYDEVKYNLSHIWALKLHGRTDR